MEFLIITGLSGAGKSRAADVFEDLDYYCVDNMPVALLPKFAELCLATQGRYEKVALVTDARERSGDLQEALAELERVNCNVRILYMDADIPTLVRRYKESRRPHPLAGRGVSMEQAIAKEVELLSPIRERADFVVNTTGMTLGKLQHRLFSLFAEPGKKREISVNVMSFGFKHGLPLDADLVFDARFLPNPYYVEELRNQTGLDRPVAEYVFQSPQARSFLEKIEDMLDFLLPLYIEEGKLGLTVAIGCTGGHHRSVAIAWALVQHFKAKGINTVNINRDIDR